jgi:hypothetical protein
VEEIILAPGELTRNLLAGVVAFLIARPKPQPPPVTTALDPPARGAEDRRARPYTKIEWPK